MVTDWYPEIKTMNDSGILTLMTANPALGEGLLGVRILQQAMCLWPLHMINSKLNISYITGFALHMFRG